MSGKSSPFKLSQVTVVRCLAISLLLSLTSCYDENDPSYEKEVLRLTAENATLATKLEVAEKENKKTSSSLSTLRTEISDHKQKTSEAAEQKIKTLEAERVKRDAEFLKLSQEIQQLKKTPPPSRPTSPNPKNTAANGEWKVQVDRNSGTGTQPSPPQQPTSPKKPQIPADPNSHKIDWNKAK